MDVERLGGMGPQCCDHRRPDGQVRNEMAVHDVDVDPVGARGVDRPHFLAEPREIGREDRRGDADGLLHGETLTPAESRSKEGADLSSAICAGISASGTAR